MVLPCSKMKSFACMRPPEVLEEGLDCQIMVSFYESRSGIVSLFSSVWSLQISSDHEECFLGSPNFTNIKTSA